MGELLIAAHLDESLWLTNQKQGAAARSYLLHSYLAGYQVLLGLIRASTYSENCRAKTCWDQSSNWHVLTFLHLIWTFRVACWAQLELLLQGPPGCWTLHVWKKYQWKVTDIIYSWGCYLPLELFSATDLVVLATWIPVVRVGRVVSLLRANEWMPSQQTISNALLWLH
jgi:hypothetical protein